MKLLIAIGILLVIATSSSAQLVKWDRFELRLVGDSTMMPLQVTGRIFLVSNSTKKSYIERIYLSGSESSEFTPIDNLIKMNPLEGFFLDAQELMWVDVAFIPNYGQLLPEKFADRHATLITIYFRDETKTIRDTTIIDLIGTFNQKLSVAQALDQSNLEVYTHNGQIIITLPDDITSPITCSLYDLLGRKLIEWPAQEANSALALPLPRLTPGVYIVKIQSNGINASYKILVQ
jgi:hypothetical protein